MKRFVLSFLISAITLVVIGNPVDLQHATTIATHAYYQKVNLYLKQVDINDLQIAEHFTIQQNGETMLYAFNFSDLGYIIISADDAMVPVIAYSFESQYSTNVQPDNFTGWLQGRAGAVKFVRESGISATPEIKSHWDSFADLSIVSLKDDGKSLEPLLTCTWNQDNPYNYYCPMDPQGPGGRALVGCVATAMSQIMYYWRYPNQGTGSHSYTPVENPQYGVQFANFGETTYDWNGMVDNSDTKINLPMALIGYHAAISVDMDFGTEGSSAYTEDVPFAMRTYFGYAYQIQRLEKNNTSLWATWKGYIEDELDLLRPLYYSGTDAPSQGSGHAFVLDGYHSDETYHFNFGWSGYGNGWFDITSPANYEWYYNQQMVRRIYPIDASYPYGCTSNFVTTNMIGSLEDGSGPLENYEENASCSWLISPQTANDSISKINLSFVFIDTETDDIITIYDGETTTSPVLGTYSGATTPPMVSSTGNKMLIVLNADGDATTGSGFKFEYSSVKPTWCSGLTLLTATSGSLNDGSENWYYENSTSCMFKIQPPWAIDLTISFTEFDTEENVDLVKIIDLSNQQVLATYSGQYTTGNLPDPITIPGGKAMITFNTDGAITRPGWTAEWEIGNSGIEDQVKGFDQLMVYPNPAEHLLNISFNANVNQSYEIRLLTASGTVVYSENNNNFSGYYVNSIDLSDFAKGVYFLNLKNDNGTVNEKVIIK